MAAPSNLPPGVTDHMVEHAYGNDGMPEENDADWLHTGPGGCGYHFDHHHEESREDERGNDYETFVCPPQGSSEDELKHFAKHGCIDYMPAGVLTDGKWVRFCEGCGNEEES